MKTDSTIETMAVVTPNCAMDKRSHISSYSTLQNPEMKKKVKYQPTCVSFSKKLICREAWKSLERHRRQQSDS